MADLAPEFDTTDELGVTKQFIGTVGTTPVLINSPSGKSIEEILIRSPNQTPKSKVLEWSLDGVIYHRLSVGEFVGWEPRSLDGGTKINKLYLKGNTSGVEYEVIMNLGVL